MSSIARLKVVLNRVEPRVVRSLEVPVTMRLSRLHTVLQIVLGWTDSHLYEFRFREVGYGIPDPDYDRDSIDARLITLQRAIKDNEALSFTYLYDFGDGWSHAVKVEKIEPAFPGIAYPLLIHASGRCPPEDIGGPSGYAEFLHILANRDHPEYNETLTWAGGPFDPHHLETGAINARLMALSTRGKKSNRR